MKKLKHWITKTINVDLDTGEQITNSERDTKYITIKKNKHVQINKTNTIGTITYTNECRRRPEQGTFQF